MTNRNRAWRRRQRLLSKVNRTRDWVSEQFEKTARAVKSAAKQPAKLTLKAQHHLAKKAQVMREGWRANQDLREAWE
jgi:hypothetical protein